MKKFAAIILSIPLFISAADAPKSEDPALTDMEELLFDEEGSLSLAESEVDEEADRLFEDSNISMSDKEEELEKLFN